MRNARTFPPRTTLKPVCNHGPGYTVGKRLNMKYVSDIVRSRRARRRIHTSFALEGRTKRFAVSCSISPKRLCPLSKFNHSRLSILTLVRYGDSCETWSPQLQTNGLDDIRTLHVGLYTLAPLNFFALLLPYVIRASTYCYIETVTLNPRRNDNIKLCQVP